MRARPARRQTAVLAAAFVSVAFLACGDDGPSPTSTSTATGTPRAEATATIAPLGGASATAVPTGTPPADLHGFTMPVRGACLPAGDQLMPNAPRTYRRGVHEGVDFYNGDSCVPITKGTPVYAMQGGTVARADLDYRELTAEDANRLDEITRRLGSTDPETLDLYRGRQVWIDHGNGVVTRYCHLSAIAPGIRVGAVVRQGDQLGGIGESGTPESVSAPGTELHLHAEVRIGSSFLGAGLPPAEVRRLYVRLFQP